MLVMVRKVSTRAGLGYLLLPIGNETAADHGIVELLSVWQGKGAACEILVVYSVVTDLICMVESEVLQLLNKGIQSIRHGGSSIAM